MAGLAFKRPYRLSLSEKGQSWGVSSICIQEGAESLRRTHLYSQRCLGLYTPCKNNHMLHWVSPVKQSSLTSPSAHTHKHTQTFFFFEYSCTRDWKFELAQSCIQLYAILTPFLNNNNKKHPHSLAMMHKTWTQNNLSAQGIKSLT